jgi:anti-sigma regulatory factor (Ser/Thr protein kinase)
MWRSGMATGGTAFGAATQDPGLRVLPETGTVDSWPLQSFLELTAVPGDVPVARRHARHVLHGWRLHGISGDTELVVSELVTNAVAASAVINQEDIRLWLASDGRRVLVLIWDSSLDSPEVVAAGDDTENGRGLLLVEALSTQWGWYFTTDIGGKVVWASLSARN